MLSNGTRIFEIFPKVPLLKAIEFIVLKSNFYLFHNDKKATNGQLSIKYSNYFTLNLKSVLNSNFQVWTLIEADVPISNVLSTYHPNKYAKINGATMVASDSITNLGDVARSLPQVIFSLGTAPE